MDKTVDVSVILCAYNEEEVIQEAVHKVDGVLKGTRWNYEIIVVDDGSLDATKQQVINYREKNGGGHLRILSYSENKGKGNAIRTGFNHSKGRVIVLLDSDLDVDPSHIPHYIDCLKTKDIAVASKWHPKSHTSTPLNRKILSIGFNTLSKLLTGIKLRDTQTGLKAFRRSVLERILPKLMINRYAFDLELMAACNHCGFKIACLPTNIHIKEVISLNEIFRMTLDLFKVAYNLQILKYYQQE